MLESAKPKQPGRHHNGLCGNDIGGLVFTIAGTNSREMGSRSEKVQRSSTLKGKCQGLTTSVKLWQLNKILTRSTSTLHRPLKIGTYKGASNHGSDLPSQSTMSSTTNNHTEEVSTTFSFMQWHLTHLPTAAILPLRSLIWRPKNTKKNTNGMPVLQR